MGGMHNICLHPSDYSIPSHKLLIEKVDLLQQQHSPPVLPRATQNFRSKDLQVTAGQSAYLSLSSCIGSMMLHRLVGIQCK